MKTYWCSYCGEESERSHFTQDWYCGVARARTIARRLPLWCAYCAENVPQNHFDGGFHCTPAYVPK